MGAQGPQVAAPQLRTSSQDPQSCSEHGRNSTSRRSGSLSGQTTHSGSGGWANEDQKKKEEEKKEIKELKASRLNYNFISHSSDTSLLFTCAILTGL